MKLLPETFEKKGFSHKCEFREGNVAVYKRQKGDQMPHWETIIIRGQKEKKYEITTPAGEVTTLLHQAKEIYPCSEDWGKRGWTYLTYEEARTKAEVLLCDQAIKNLTSE